MSKLLSIAGIFIFIVINLSASIWNEFLEYPSNPVVNPANSGLRAYYPTTIYSATQFDNHGQQAYYKMWYATASGIGHSYSNDGINWTEYNGSNNLTGIPTSASHPVVLYDSNGFGGSNYYKMWFWDPSVNYALIGTLKYAESTDGITWTNSQSLQQHPSDSSLQLLTGTGVYNNYFYHAYGPGSVLYNPAGTNTGSATPDNKTDDQPMSYKYVMYYDSSSEGSSPENSYEQTSLAYSTDGLYWIRYGDTPVLIPSGDSNDWDGKYSYRASVVYVDGTYHMWYAGANGDNSIGTYYAHGIGYASSPDGLNWTIDSENPIFHVTDGVTWRDVRSYTPCVLYDSSGFSGHGERYRYKMWFTGRTGSDYTVGYARSDFIQFPPTACFIVDQTSGIFPLEVNFDASCSNDPDGTIVNYNWDFRDGSPGSGLTTSHTFNSAGRFNVILTVTDNDGFTDQASQIISVDPRLEACFSVSSAYGYTPATITFNADCSTHFGNQLLLYTWLIDDITVGNGISFTFTFVDENTYVITLLITDEDGYTHSVSKTIYIRTIHPPAGITLDRYIDRSLFLASAYHVLKWNINPKNEGLSVSKYNIYRKLQTESDSSYRLIGTVPSTEFEYIDKNLPIDTIYTYIIKSVEVSGHEGPSSAPVSNRLD